MHYPRWDNKKRSTFPQNDPCPFRSPGYGPGHHCMQELCDCITDMCVCGRMCVADAPVGRENGTGRGIWTELIRVKLFETKLGYNIGKSARGDQPPAPAPPPPPPPPPPHAVCMCTRDCRHGGLASIACERGPNTHVLIFYHLGADIGWSIMSKEPCIVCPLS